MITIRLFLCFVLVVGLVAKFVSVIPPALLVLLIVFVLVVVFFVGPPTGGKR